MKTTGITRRIDELGRIVIPKEIRKNMHIKPGELLEIFLNDSDTILLKKHNVINKNNEFIDTFINNLAIKISANIFITNTEKIIFSTIPEQKFKNISNSLENYNLNNKVNNIYLSKERQLKKPYDIFLISPNGDFVGYMIFEYMKNVDKTTEDLVKFSFDFIQTYFENE